MPRLVIIMLVLSQRFEKHDTERRKQKIGSGNDQKHRKEEHYDCFDCVIYGNCNRVSGTERQNSENGKNPSGFRFPLPFTGAAEQFHRAGKVDDAQRVCEDHKINGRKEDRRNEKCEGVKAKPESNISTEDPQKEQLQKFCKYNAEKNAETEDKQDGIQRFKRKNPADMAFLHAEDIVDGEFPFAGFCQNAVCVKQNDGGKYGNDDTAEAQNERHGYPAADSWEHRIVCERQHDEKHHHGDGSRKQIRKIESAVVFDIGRCKPGIEKNTVTHVPHLPGRSHRSRAESAYP